MTTSTHTAMPAGRKRRCYVIEPDPAFRAELLTLADEAREQAGSALAAGHDIHGASYLGTAAWLTRMANGDTQ